MPSASKKTAKTAKPAKVAKAAKAAKLDLTNAAADKVASKQRRIQKVQDDKDRRKRAQSAGAKPGKKAVQAGAVNYPENPLPSQHLKKPGHEADMQLRPHFMAPAYRGSGKLAGMAAIITGGDSGIGRAVAVLLRAKALMWRWLISTNMKMQKRQSAASKPRAHAAY